MRPFSPFTLLLAVAAITAARPARAQTPASGVPTAATTAPEPPLPTAAITFSPAHLFIPMVEVTGELRLNPRVGLAAILGYGRLGGAGTDVVPRTRADIYELGSQMRYYVFGNFRHGMQVGAEVLYLRGSSDGSGVSAVANGFALGPFAGYKYTASFGFTFDFQLGAERIGMWGSNSAGTKNASISTWIPLLNLNVGWSF